jgi:hypothetical protein
VIVIVGLLVLAAAAAVAVFGVAANSGGAHPLGDSFSVLGQHLNGLSTGQLFLGGVVVGVVGMLGLSLLLGPLTRHVASRGSRRELRGSQRETTHLRQDRDRLAQQLDEKPVTSGAAPPSDVDLASRDKSTAAASPPRPT